MSETYRVDCPECEFEKTFIEDNSFNGVEKSARTSAAGHTSATGHDVNVQEVGE